MIKGAQKQMIVLRTGGSRYFDEAYFVLRRGVTPDRAQEPDLLTEAKRILAESESRKTGKRMKPPAWLWFALGLATGTFGALITTACLQLL